MNTSTNNVNNDLNKMKNWAILWKVNFDRDPSKQAQEVLFRRELLKANHNHAFFNHNSVKRVPSEEHLGTYLDTKLNFLECLNNILSKVK